MVYNYKAVGSHPGTYAFQLTIQNRVSIHTVHSILFLQRSVSGVSLNSSTSTTPWNTSTYWQIDFGSLGSDACYLLDVKDSAAGTYLSTHCCMLIDRAYIIYMYRELCIWVSEPGRVFVFGDINFCQYEAHTDLLTEVDAVREAISMKELEAEAEMNNGAVQRQLEIIWWTLKRHDVTLIASNFVSNEEHHHLYESKSQYSAVLYARIWCLLYF